MQIHKYKFDDIKGVELHGIRNDLIIGSFLHNGEIELASWKLNGKMWNCEYTNFNLTPEDPFLDLKQCYSEGARIEYSIFSGNKKRWLEVTQVSDLWCNLEYRIKDDISVEQWNQSSTTIKAYWNGSEIESTANRTNTFQKDEIPEWSLLSKYRIQTLKLTKKQILKKYNIEVI